MKKLFLDKSMPGSQDKSQQELLAELAHLQRRISEHPTKSSISRWTQSPRSGALFPAVPPRLPKECCASRSTAQFWLRALEPSPPGADGSPQQAEGNLFGELEEADTSRKVAEAALCQSEEKYRLLAENLHDAIVSFSMDGKLNYCSPNVMEFGGYDPDEEIGNPIDKYVAVEEDIPRIYGVIAEILAEKRSKTTEFLYKPKNRDPFPVEVTSYPVIEAGEVVRLNCVVRDITERKKAEQELQESREELSAIYESAPLMMIVVDEDRRVVKANRATTQFIGQPEEEIVGLRGGEALKCIHALDAPEGCGFGIDCQHCIVRNTVLDTLATGTTHHRVEATIYDRSG